MSTTDLLKMSAAPGADNLPSKKKVTLGGPRDYLRGALGAKHKWWKVLLTGLIGIPLFYSFLIFGRRIILSLLGEEGQRIREFVSSGGNPMDKPIVLAVQFLPAALAVLVFMIVLPLVGGRKFGTLSSIKGRLRWGVILRAVIVATPLMSCLLLLQFAIGRTLDVGVYALQILIMLALIPFQVAAEEYLVRGWLIQALGACRVPALVAVMASAGIFALMHHHYGLIGLITMVIMGLSCAWLTIRTGGVEAAIVGHGVYNIFVGLSSLVVGNNPTSDSGMSWLSVVIISTPFVLYTIIADIWLRRAIIKREGREVMVGALGGPIGTFGETPVSIPAISQASPSAPQRLESQVQYSS